MKLIKYRSANGPAWAIAQPDGSFRAVVGDILGDFAAGASVDPGPERLAPVASDHLFAVGANYTSHVAEARAAGIALPDYFYWLIKAPGSLLDPDGEIRIPVSDHKIDYEAELCIVLKKTARNLTPENALEHVLGYTVANDVTARGWQMDRHSGPTIAKSFDTFGPIGPVLVTPDELPLPLELALATRVNGVTLQRGNTRDLIYDVPAMLVELSRDRTLPAGCAILTGNPPGSQAFSPRPQWLKPGDLVEVEIEGIGVLRNRVVAGS